jgi:hypothetical protein
MLGAPRLFTIAAAALHAKLSADLDDAAASMPLPKLQLSLEQQAALLQPSPPCPSASKPLPAIAANRPPAQSPRPGHSSSLIGTPRGQQQALGRGRGQEQGPRSPQGSELLDPELRLHSLRLPWATRAWQAVRQPLRKLRLRQVAAALKVFEADASQRSACRSVGGSRHGGAGSLHGAPLPASAAAAALLGAEVLPAGGLLQAEEVDVVERLLEDGSRHGSGSSSSWRRAPPPPGPRLEGTQRGSGQAAQLLAAAAQPSPSSCSSRRQPAWANAWQGEDAPLEGSCHGMAAWLNWSSHAGHGRRLTLDLDDEEEQQQEQCEGQGPAGGHSGSLAAYVAIVLEPSEHGAQAMQTLLQLQAWAGSDGGGGEGGDEGSGRGPCSSAGQQRSEISSWDELQQPGGEGAGEAPETCGVCLDECVQVQVVGCSHRLCMGCCKELVRLHYLKPASCPFCRTCIGGFELVL